MTTKWMAKVVVVTAVMVAGTAMAQECDPDSGSGCYDKEKARLCSGPNCLALKGLLTAPRGSSLMGPTTDKRGLLGLGALAQGKLAFASSKDAEQAATALLSKRLAPLAKPLIEAKTAAERAAAWKAIRASVEGGEAEDLLAFEVMTVGAGVAADTTKKADLGVPSPGEDLAFAEKLHASRFATAHDLSVDGRDLLAKKLKDAKQLLAALEAFVEKAGVRGKARDCDPDSGNGCY